MAQRPVVSAVSDPWTPLLCLPVNFRRATKVGTLGFAGSSNDLNPIKCFSFSELRSATEQFSAGNILDDENPTVTVYRGVLASGHEVKIRRVLQADKSNLRQFQDNVGVLSRLHHPHLVRLVGFCNKRREQLLVYEALTHGTLSDHLHDPERARLPWQNRLEIVVGVARGIAHVHEHASAPSVHRNIKSSTIFLDDKLVPKVSEVGHSNLKMSDDTESRSSMGYLPPEFYCTRTITDKFDVYAFGVVLMELLTAKRSFDRQRHYINEKVLLVDLIRSAVKQGGWAAVQPKLDPEISSKDHDHAHAEDLERLLNLALHCTEEDLDNRPSMKDLVAILEAFMR